MADVYAYLDRDRALSFVRRKGDGWTLTPRPTGDGGGRRLTVFVDGLDISTHLVDVPSRSEAELRRAAPFAIEDELAEPIDDVHVAIAPPPERDSAGRQVSALAHSRLAETIDLLSDAGFPEAQLVAAHAVLPQGPILVDAGDLVLGRIGNRAFTLDRDVGSDVFASLIEGEDDVRILGEGLAATLSRPSAGAGASGLEDFLAMLADWAETSDPAPGLRQGRYAPGRQLDLSGVGHWRFAGALAAAFTLGWLGTIGLQLHGMSSRVDQLDARAVSFAEAGWPQSGGDVRSALALANAAGSSQGLETSLSPLSMLAVLYAELEDGAGDLKTVRYDRASQRMSVRIGFADFVSVDELSSALEEAGLNVETGDARQSAGEVIGELSIGAAK